MQSEIVLTQEIRQEQRNQTFFRILILLSVPALGFLSAAVTYLSFYTMESSWTLVVLPPSVLVVALILFEGIAPFFARENKPLVSLKILNQVYLIIIVYFILASAGWLYYLVKFIELHK